MVKLNLGTPTPDVSTAKPEKPAIKAPKRKRKEKESPYCNGSDKQTCKTR